MIQRIIIADDHCFVRRGLVQILKETFPEVDITETDNGNALVEQVQQTAYDLVISDLEMPGHNGLEALDIIKSIQPELPVLILSIYPEELYAVRALKSGASGYLNKSSAPEELITAINRVLSGKKYISQEIAEKLISNFDKRKELHETLTNKEFEILRSLAGGKSLPQIAKDMCLAIATISAYRTKILHKLGLANSSEITRYAHNHHIISMIETKTVSGFSQN